jgi:hypothetical protein
MLCKNNVGVLDKSVTLTPSISINKNSYVPANVHLYNTIFPKIVSQTAITVSGEIRHILAKIWAIKSI